MVVIQSSQIRAARALLGWSQEDLSQKAKVSLGTVIRMESFAGAVQARAETLQVVIAVLERAGIEFLEEGHGVRWRARRS